MTLSVETLRDLVMSLRADILYLEERASRAPDASEERDSLDRIINVKARLLAETQEAFERAADRAVREAAEARWRFHEANDTLDLY